MSTREVSEGTQYQGKDEIITYSITTTNWDSSPTSASMVVKNSSGTDVTSSVTTGSISTASDILTLKPISGLTAGERYKVEVQFTAGSGAPWECYFYIECES